MNSAKSIISIITKPVRKMSSARPFTVIVEGNIGSGKTTFLNHFPKGMVMSVYLPEPIDIPHQMEFHVPVICSTDNVKSWHACKTSSPVKLMERSIYSAEKLARDGLMLGPSVAVIDESGLTI
ncbi:hypothetical protein NQ317_009362 [Molorchus minor]|uniref:KAP NTPase domain-containing protein n=1 Tax=Molorchus minor TaxID=1323400 RepID=A0ABQ9JNZ6_9CUCU|nr:hypothetical protein NQ317_009362 [Molorchus minor]